MNNTDTRTYGVTYSYRCVLCPCSVEARSEEEVLEATQALGWGFHTSRNGTLYAVCPKHPGPFVLHDLLETSLALEEATRLLFDIQRLLKVDVERGDGILTAQLSDLRTWMMESTNWLDDTEETNDTD